MSRYGDGSAWWRVTDAAGNLGSDLLERARPHWLEEGIAVNPSGRGCRIQDHRADLDDLARQWEVAVSDVEPM